MIIGLGPSSLTVVRNNGKIEQISLIRPSDWHAHLRHGNLMQAVTPHILRGHKYVLVMPNNGPDEGGIIRHINSALGYRREIMKIAEQHGIEGVTLVMTLYHTRDTTPDVIERLAKIRDDQGIYFGIKHYPPHPGATTGSGHGISLDDSDDMLKAMESCSIPLLGHLESVVDRDNRPLHPNDREGYYMGAHFRPLRDKYPRLKITIEHGSTIDAVECVKEDDSGRTSITFTPQHLLYNNSVFGRPGANQFKCMPNLKPEEHRVACLEFAGSGDVRAYAGTDIAPHPYSTKVGDFDKANNGCYTPDSIGMYADAFARVGKLSIEFVRFMSLNGAGFWGLPLPEARDMITLVPWEQGIREPLAIPGTKDTVVPIGYVEEGDPSYRTPFILSPNF